MSHKCVGVLLSLLFLAEHQNTEKVQHWALARSAIKTHINQSMLAHKESAKKVSSGQSTVCPQGQWLPTAALSWSLQKVYKKTATSQKQA
jgi:hypothetical protein